MAFSIQVKPQSVTETTKQWVIAHEPNSDFLHQGRMEIIAWAIAYPDDQELQLEECGQDYESCPFIIGSTGRRCGLDFYISKDSVLQPIQFRGNKNCEVACGQRPAARERGQ